MRSLCTRTVQLAAALLCTTGGYVSSQPAPTLVLDHVRLIDGSGAAPRDDTRILVRGDRIETVGPAADVAVPEGAERLDLTGRTVIPGLIDLHFHIEDDPRLALHQLANGVTSFRDPGQWNEAFVPLRSLMEAEHLAGPRMALAGPHIDGERPAYPNDSVDRARSRGGAPGCGAEHRGGRDRDQDLLPPAPGERQGRDRGVPRARRAVHGPSRDHRCR